MTREQLDKVCGYLIDNVFQNEQIMFVDCEKNNLPEIIASLFELLHKEVTGEPYQYFFHWANKIGAYVDDDLFEKEVLNVQHNHINE